MASLRTFFLRSQPLRPSLSSHLATPTTPLRAACAAAFSSSATRPFDIPTSTTSRPAKTESYKVPQPTPFIPDVETFLTVIGRNLKQHASKFPTWDSLFALTSQQMRDLGVEPARSRKYLMRWRRRFQNEEYGPGGEFRHVKDGVAELRVLEVQKKKTTTTTTTPQDATAAAAAAPGLPVKMRYVVNMPEGVRVEDVVGTAAAEENMTRVLGYKVHGRSTVVGPYAIPLRDGRGARVKVTEGMWEDKLGRKIDGGERRRTEVRYKKRIQERRQARERAFAQN
ncbi:IGR protein motif-domain-containing protein [Microdochium bolleyi]|uniref:Small ribosomal subunit protein mS41 n=1 Tax=Microdochium bolleyi TaxID=196109 RepID=A0A136J7Y6_9PEZI|nr:IGR protein motif-domain-containing protein [Microdochium bolleyi]